MTVQRRVVTGTRVARCVLSEKQLCKQQLIDSRGRGDKHVVVHVDSSVGVASWTLRRELPKQTDLGTFTSRTERGLKRPRGNKTKVNEYDKKGTKLNKQTN